MKDDVTIVHSCGSGCGGALGQVVVDGTNEPCAVSTSWLPGPTQPFYFDGFEDRILKLEGRSDTFVAVGASGNAFTAGSRKAGGGQFFRPSNGARSHPRFAQWDHSLQNKKDENTEPPFGKQCVPIQIASVPGIVRDVASSDDVTLLLLEDGRVYSVGIREEDATRGGVGTTPLGRVPTRSMIDGLTRKWDQEAICEEYPTPQEIIFPHNFVAKGVSTGAFHAFAWGKLNGESAVFAWGNNKDGQVSSRSSTTFATCMTQSHARMTQYCLVVPLVF